MASFHRYIGIDYSGAATADTRLTGIRVYDATRDDGAVEVRPVAGARAHWTRRGLAQWLVRGLEQAPGAIVGIDHGFSFPAAYFDAHALKRDWPAFMEDFHQHWPTDEWSVESVRVGAAGNGQARGGNARWKRDAERRSAFAKSVFHFDVQGSVAKSTHAGLPWLRFIRNALPERVHFWPFDGWSVAPGKSVVAEAYPRLYTKRAGAPGLTADQQDAHAIATWLRAQDLEGTLAGVLDLPLSEAQREVANIEGWILGVNA